MRRAAFFIGAALLALLGPAPMAQEISGFRSPSGNIHCQSFGIEGDVTVRCDLAQISNRPPPRPRDCDLEWGQAFEVTGRGSRGARLCYGDTVQDPRLPVLPYGRTWQHEGLFCRSEQGGVACQNARGHGFELSRTRQRVF